MAAAMRMSRRARWMVALIGLGGLLCTGWVTYVVYVQERQAQQLRFARGAEMRAEQIWETIERTLGTLETMRGLFTASRDVERDEFGAFVAPLLGRYRELQGIGWVPRVPARERAALEAALRSAGAGAQGLTALNAQGRLVPFADAAVAEHYPLLFVEPQARLASLIGFDQQTATPRAAAMAQARDTGQTILTEPAVLASNPTVPSVLAFVPLYDGGTVPATVAERRVQLRGFIAAAILMEQLVNEALRPLPPAGIDLDIYDSTILDNERMFYRHASRLPSAPRPRALQRPDHGLTQRAVFDMAGRRWTIVCRATPAFGGISYRHVLSISALGLLFTLVCMGYVAALQRRTDDIEHLVAERTAALSAENTERRRLAEQLTQTTAALEQQNAALQHRERLMQSLLEDVQASKAQLTDQTEELKRSEQALLNVLADLKRSHEELRATQAQLIQAAKLESVGRLAAGVAHEVKNPLAILLQGLHYLTTHPEGDRAAAAQVLTRMTEAVHRADNVIREVLNFSSPHAPTLVPTAVAEVIEQALVLVQHELSCGAYTVVKDYDPALPLVPMDHTKIEQVLVNVLMNALHAMPQGGTLTLRTRHAAGPGAARSAGDAEVRIEVDDTGPGIPPEQLAKVFDPFFTTKPVGQGTGLGLSVSRKIMELHGGTLELANRPEGGVRTTLTLPIRSSAHVEATHSHH